MKKAGAAPRGPETARRPAPAACKNSLSIAQGAFCASPARDAQKLFYFFFPWFATAAIFAFRAS